MIKAILIDLYNVLIFQREGAETYDPVQVNSPQSLEYSLGLMEYLAKTKLPWYVVTAVDNVTLDYELMGLLKSYGCIDVYETNRLGLDKRTAYTYEFIVKNKLGLKPTDTVYLDDTEKNITAAINAGLSAIVFKDAKQAENWLKSMLVD
jgi:FMN phosphatase YigB (HAD superfamily)